PAEWNNMRGRAPEWNEKPAERSMPRGWGGEPRGGRELAGLVQEPLDPGHALDDRVAAHRVRQPQVAARPERLARHDGDLRLLEEQLRELGRGRRAAPADLLAEHALHGGVGVEGALRRRADDAVDLVEHPHDRPAPAVEG